MKQIKFEILQPDFIRGFPADEHELSVIERLVKDADISAYLSNPAISDSRFLALDDGVSSGEDSPDLADIIVWNLPGHGLPSPSDGWVKKAFACENGDYFKPVKQSCHKLSCPNCCYEKMSETAENVKEKIMNARKFSRSEFGGHDDVLQHVVISPPKAEYGSFTTLDGFRRMRLYASQICAEIGLKGGVLVFHPFRQDGVNGSLVPDDYEPDESNSLDFKKWRFSPHFHVVGFGRIKPSSSDFVRCHHNWIYSALRTGKRKMRSSVDIYAVVRYTLTHVGVLKESTKRIQSVSYFGLCNSRNQVKIGEIVISRAHKCPCCDGRIHKLIIGRDRVIDCGEHRKTDVYPMFTTADEKRRNNGFLDEYPFDILQNPVVFSSITKSSLLKQLQSDPTAEWTFKRPTVSSSSGKGARPPDLPLTAFFYVDENGDLVEDEVISLS